MGPVVCLPLVLSPASSLPATHREVRHSVVVRLEHSGVLEDVIPKRVEPIQRDQEISAADPLLERKQGRHKQVFLPCSPGKSCPLVLGKWGVALGHRDRLAETNPEDRPGIRRPGSILGLLAVQFVDKAQCLGASFSMCKMQPG